MPNEGKLKKTYTNPISHITNFNAAFADEEIVILIESGEIVYRFAVAPKHFKRIVQLLSHTLGNYETKFGELKTSWKPTSPKTSSDEAKGFHPQEDKTGKNEQ